MEHKNFHTKACMFTVPDVAHSAGITQLYNAWAYNQQIRQ